MSVYSISPADKVQLSFVLERIYQRRDGATAITADVLVENLGNTKVNKVRIAFPYDFVNVDSLLSSRTEAGALSEIQKLQNEQLRHIDLNTLPLLSGGDKSNWIYHTITNVTIDKETSKAGMFGITRCGQSTGSSGLKGYIKNRWTCKFPKEIQADPWLWLFYAVNEVTLVDLEAPKSEPRELLNEKESMWLRLQIKIPPIKINRYSRARKMFARHLEYHQVFMSSHAVAAAIATKLEKFSLPPSTLPNIMHHVTAAQIHASRLTPDPTQKDDSKDWRLFLYREYSLTVQEPVQRGGEPCKPRLPKILPLPFEADEQDCRRGPGPRWIHRKLVREPRMDICHEFWIGSEHSCSRDIDYIIESSSQALNPFYNYVVWTSLLLSIVNLLNGIFHFW